MFSASTTELYFPKPHNRVITNTVKFTNNTSIDAVVKMRTTSREKFHVRPRIFAIRRGESVEVSVSSRVLPGDIPEIDKSDECHAVIHQLSSANSSQSNNNNGGNNSNSSLVLLMAPEALQLAWDAGTHLGRVVLRCHVAEPPSGSEHKLMFANENSAPTTSRTFSKSPSLPRSSTTNTLPQHSRDVSDMSVASQNAVINNSNNNNAAAGKPPLGAIRRGSEPAHVQFQRDSEVQQYLQNNNNNNKQNNQNIQQQQQQSPANASANQQQQQLLLHGAVLEKFSEKVQNHENALDDSARQLTQLAATATKAAENVRAQVMAREEKKQNLIAEASASSSSSSGGLFRIKRVPLSVAVFFMVLSFLAGVLMRQSAYQHHLDTVDAASN